MKIEKVLVKPQQEELDLSKIKGGMANPEEDNARSICMPVGNVHNECMINGSTKKPATLDVI